VDAGLKPGPKLDGAIKYTDMRDIFPAVVGLYAGQGWSQSDS